MTLVSSCRQKPHSGPVPPGPWRGWDSADLGLPWDGLRSDVLGRGAGSPGQTQQSGVVLHPEISGALIISKAPFKFNSLASETERKISSLISTTARALRAWV